MIRKDNVDVIEMNRKMISKATIKPNLNAFPVRDISVPFNSSRNAPSLSDMALEKPVSFLEKNIGIAQQIESIRNNRNPVVQLKKHNTRPQENIKMEVVDIEDDYRNNVLPVLSPAETNDKVLELVNDIKTEIKYENAVMNKKKQPRNKYVALPKGVKLPSPPSPEEIKAMNNNARINNNSRRNNNNLVRSIMDINANAHVSKHLVILFFVVMAIMIYSGQHKRLLR